MRRRSPATRGSRATGSTGFEGAGLDGVITKRVDTAYQHDTRVMLKIKHVRTVNFVVAGTACKSPPPARLDRLRSGGRTVRAPAVRARRQDRESASCSSATSSRQRAIGAPSTARREPARAVHPPRRRRDVVDICAADCCSPYEVPRNDARRRTRTIGELRAAWTVCDRAALFYKQTGPSKERTALLTHRWARRVITRHS
jgi:hypothetical protein